MRFSGLMNILVLCGLKSFVRIAVLMAFRPGFCNIQLHNLIRGPQGYLVYYDGAVIKRCVATGVYPKGFRLIHRIRLQIIKTFRTIKLPLILGERN